MAVSHLLGSLWLYIGPGFLEPQSTNLLLIYGSSNPKIRYESKCAVHLLLFSPPNLEVEGQDREARAGGTNSNEKVPYGTFPLVWKSTVWYWEGVPEIPKNS